MKILKTVFLQKNSCHIANLLRGKRKSLISRNIDAVFDALLHLATAGRDFVLHSQPQPELVPIPVYVAARGHVARQMRHGRG